MRQVGCSLYTQRKTKCHWIIWFFCLCFTRLIYFLGVLLFYRVVLASAVQPRDRVYVYICPLPPEPASHAPPPGHRRARSRAPGAVPQISAGRLVHTRESGSVSAALSVLPSSTILCPRPFSTSVSLFLPCKEVHLDYFSRFRIYALIYNICNSLSDLLHSVRQWLYMLFF